MPTAADPPAADPPTGGGELPADVLRRFAAGDETAFAQVYERYAGPMFTVALRALGRRDLAADVVQQAFLQAWRAAATVSPDAPIAPWLFTITRRCAIDAWRKESRHDAVDTSSSEVDHGSSAGPGISGPGMESVWEAWQVRSALTQLTADERAVVKLAYVEGLSQSQIAGHLGLPLGTVKSRSSRAHRRLSQLLSHLAPEPRTALAP
jgi:RNA polymerase sigma-70 factor (ECF subfamily)